MSPPLPIPLSLSLLFPWLSALIILTCATFSTPCPTPTCALTVSSTPILISSCSVSPFCTLTPSSAPPSIPPVPHIFRNRYPYLFLDSSCYPLLYHYSSCDPCSIPSSTPILTTSIPSHLPRPLSYSFVYRYPLLDPYPYIFCTVTFSFTFLPSSIPTVILSCSFTSSSIPTTTPASTLTPAPCSTFTFPSTPTPTVTYLYFFSRPLLLTAVCTLIPILTVSCTSAPSSDVHLQPSLYHYLPVAPCLFNLLYYRIVNI